VAALLSLLQDSDADIRKAALFAISNIGDNSAIERLLELVCLSEQSEDALVIKALLEAANELERISMANHLLTSLQDIVDYQDVEPKLKWLGAVLTLFHLEGKSGLAELLTLLRNDREKSIDDLIVDVFMNLHGDGAAERLLTALSGDLWLTRENAGLILSRLNNDCIIPCLIEIVVNSDNWVGERAAAVLGKIGRRGDKRVEDALLPLLDSGDEHVRDLSAKMLGILRVKEAIPKLIHMLRTDTDESARSMAAVALEWAGYDEFAPELADALQDPYVWVRIRTVAALANIPDERAISLLRQALRGDVDKDVRRGAAKALGKLKAQSAVPDLTLALGKEVEKETRYEILEALGEIGGAQAYTGLAFVLKDDPDETVRHGAATALAKLGGEQAALALLDALEHDEGVRSGAVSAIECLKYEVAVNTLADVLVSGEQWVQTMAARSPRNSSGWRAASELITALALVDSQWTTKKAAEAISAIDNVSVTNGLIINLSSHRMAVKRIAAERIGYYSRSGQVLQMLIALSSDSESEETRSAARTAIWKLRRLPKEFLPDGVKPHEPEGPHESVQDYPSRCSLVDTLSDPLAEIGPEVFTAITSATTHDEAHCNLAVMLTERDTADEAERELRSWVRCLPLNSDAHYGLGWFLDNQERLDEAEREYLEAIRLNSQEERAHNNLGLIYKQHYKYEAAEHEFREAIRCDPDFGLARRNLGALLREFGRLEEAEAELREACQIDPNDSEALFKLSRTLNELKRVEEAKESYLKHLKLFGASVGALNNLGLLHEQEGCNEKAEECFRQSIECEPNLIQPHRNLKALLLRAERVGEAESELLRWIHHGDSLSELHNDLAELLAGQGRADEAVEIYREWLVCEPDNTAAFPYLINILVKHDRMAEAETACRNWVEKNDEVWQANSSLWNFLIDCGRVAEALNEYLRWMSSGGDKGWVSRYFAETLIEKGFAKEAEKVLLDAVQHHPTTLSYHSDLAKFYAGQGRLEDAERVFRGWLAEHRGDSEAHLELGILFAEAGHIVEAEGELIMSLKCYDAEDDTVPFSFVWSVKSAYMKCEKYTEGAAIFTKLMQVNPDITDAYIARGSLYWYGGALREALSDFNRALELDPENGLILNSRGQVLAELGEYDAAIIDLKRAIELDERGNAFGVKAYALNGLAFAFGAKGEMNEAMQLFQKSIGLSPENAWLYFNRGIIQAHSGNTIDAESDFILSLEKSEPSLPRRKREASLSYLLHLRGGSNRRTTDN
jgi:tetratricopeptide (TPR) repeat protein